MKTNLDIERIFKTYYKDHIIRQLQDCFFEVNDLLSKATSDEARSKVSSTKLKIVVSILNRTTTLQNRKRLNAALSISVILCLMSSIFCAYQNYSMSMNNASSRKELFTMLSEELEQGQQEQFEELHRSIASKMDENFNKLNQRITEIDEKTTDLEKQEKQVSHSYKQKVRLE